MTEKTAQQIARMKEQTIGVEVEMNHICRDKAAKVASDFFGTGRVEYTHSRNGYSTWSAWDTQGREWKFQKDVSIAGSDDEKCEMVTPILHYNDIETLQELVRRLRRAGDFAEPEQFPIRRLGQEFTSTLVRTDTQLRHSAIWQISWQATRSFWQMP